MSESPSINAPTNSLVLTALVQRMRKVDAGLLEVTQDLSEAQFCKRLGPTAPPIGWHLWHTARWGDRLQASFPMRASTSNERPDPNRDIWHCEQLAAKWGLEPATLGGLETGIGMEHDAAALLPQTVGQQNLFDYSRRVFQACELAVESLTANELDCPRESIIQLEIKGKSIRVVPGNATTHAADVIFHLTHANRHYGSIEALCGLLDAKA
jgi:hypothetical protein